MEPTKHLVASVEDAFRCTNCNKELTKRWKFYFETKTYNPWCNKCIRIVNQGRRIRVHG